MRRDATALPRTLIPQMSLICAALAVSLAATRASEPSACPTLWLDMGGSGEEACLTISQTWPLAFFESRTPAWEPARHAEDGRYLGPAARNLLNWGTGAARTVRSVGAFGGRIVYDFGYSDTYHVFAWGTGGGGVRPVLIVAGDESFIAPLYAAERVVSGGRELIHVRVELNGTGRLQESVFLGWDGASVVALRPRMEGLRDWLAARQLSLYHRGGGFCRGTASFRAGVEDRSGQRVGTVVAEFAIDGAGLAPFSIRLDADRDEAAEAACELYPNKGARR